jgi:hypothetical protein
MANLFAITTATDEIKADANGRAVAIFTVTNTSSGPVRSVAKTKAIGNTQQGWLDVQGEIERDFSAGGTQQFTVNFNKPPTPPAPNSPPPAAEKFPFRLDVASSVNPDEEFTEGPQVNVEVTPAAAPSKKAFPWWIILVVLGALLLVGGLIWFLVAPKSGGEKPKEPRLAGTWVGKDISRQNPLKKFEIQENGNNLKATFWSYDSDKPFGPFNGAVGADGASGQVAGRGGDGFMKTDLQLTDPDHLSVVIYYYDKKSDAEGQPNETYKQILSKQ